MRMILGRCLRGRSWLGVRDRKIDGGLDRLRRVNFVRIYIHVSIYELVSFLKNVSAVWGSQSSLFFILNEDMHTCALILDRVCK